MADQSIINKHGVFHTIPDGADLPAGARKATKDEIAAWQKQDEAAKAVILKDKQDKRAARAQLVVVSGAPEPEKSKKADDK